MQKITPRKQAGKSFFSVTFRNPYKGGKLTTASLQTDDPDVARGIADDIARLCDKPELWQDPDSPALLDYLPRAVFVVTGKTPAERATPRLRDREVGVLAQRISEATGTPEKFEYLIETLKHFETATVRELFKEVESRKSNELAMKRRIETLVADLERRARKENEHVTTPIADAFEWFKGEYVKGHARQTISEVFRWVGDFIKSLPEQGRTKLGTIRKDAVNTWLESMSADLSPVTRQRRKMYLSAFFTECQSKYDLAEHPVQTAIVIKGASSAPENIEHLDLEEITQLFKVLEKRPYWLAWASFAILAGPRWGEQASLPISAVHLADQYVEINARKTGRRRRVPIEQTVLLPILEKHVAERQRQQKRGKTDAERSPWLFPTLLPPHPYMERKISAPGVWSSARGWHDAWNAIVPEKQKGKRIWTMGPKEWRHSFGTALGQCGFTALEIAHLMGNSPKVCGDHYVAVSTAGQRWPFKW